MTDPLHFVTLVPQSGLETIPQKRVACSSILNRLTCTNGQVFTVFGSRFFRARKGLTELLNSLISFRLHQQIKNR